MGFFEQANCFPFLAVFVLSYANRQEMKLSDQEQHLTKGEGRGLTSHLIIFKLKLHPSSQYLHLSKVNVKLSTQPTPPSRVKGYMTEAF